MKGLLIKDIRLLLGQKRFILMVIGFGLFFMMMNRNPSMGVGYITLLLTIFTMSTLSYDEYDNGMTFLLTLPISRKTYVREKYVFGGLLAVLAAAVSSIVAVFVGTVMKMEVSTPEIVTTGVVLAGMSLLIMAISIPMQIKYGTEKGRIAMFLVMGAAFMLMVLTAKAFSFVGSNVDAIAAAFVRMNKWFLLAGAAAIFALILFLSYHFCIRIMNKKEY